VTRVWSHLVLLALAAGSLSAQTREQAKAFVKQAVEYAKTHPRAKFLEQVTDEKGLFHFQRGRNDGLYLFVYDTHGKVLAHGARRELVGLDRWTSRDAQGKFWVQEWTNLAVSQGSGWTQYMELNPAQGNQVMKKSSWVELHKGMVIGAGIYE
jgi:signal transduction histidine kinase